MLKVLILLSCLLFTSNADPKVGDIIDSHNGIPVYYNGKFSNVLGRNYSEDGYNYGLKWQCVEYIKRYYYEIHGHKMPNSYGHAKEFFNKDLEDVAFNEKRGLMQYRNVRYERPQVDDILIYDGQAHNKFGHIAIITEVTDTHVEIIQQNMGKKSRVKLKLVNYNGIYTVADFNILGWLRK